MFDFPFDVRRIKDVRSLFRFFLRFLSLFRMCLVVSPGMSEAKTEYSLKTLNECKESRYQSSKIAASYRKNR